MNDFYKIQNKNGVDIAVGNKLLIDGKAGKLEVCTHMSLSNISNISNLPDNPDILIMCHPHPLYQGTMDNKVVTSAISAFNQEGALSVRFNFRGIGNSEGEYDKGIGESEDVISVYNWVKSCFPKSKIILGGFSFGAYVAYRAKDSLDIEKLILLAPAVRFENDMLSLPEPKVPVLIVMGDADEVIPPDDILDWVRGLSCSYNLVKLNGVSHFFHHNLSSLKSIIKSYYLY